jgi:HD-like signal output (HDOD) protein
LGTRADNLNVISLIESNLIESNQEVDAAESHAMKQHALNSLGNLPPFSVIMNRLMASLAGKEVGFAKLGELIEKDAVISGNLLHLVNSALYARRGTVNSVRHALSLLGIEKVRNAVLGMSVTRMWNRVSMPPSFSIARFNIHSSSVAILSDCLAQRVRVNYAEGAFVAGLLHDVGRLLIAQSLPDEYEQILTMHQSDGRPMRECERSVLGFAHEELSAEALAYWNLPERIQSAVLYHHDLESDRTAVGAKEIPLSRVLGAANEFVNSLGITILSNANSAATRAVGFGTLGLDEVQTRDVLAEFETERDAMAQFFR